MKKVIIRLVVVALAIALVVLILLNTVFKVSNTQKVYNSLNDAFSSSGTITSMTKELHDLDEFDSAYGDYVVIFSDELKNLQSIYPKLYYLFNEDDDKLTSIVENLDQMQESLKKATKTIKEVNQGKIDNDKLDVNAFVEKIKPEIVNALEKVIDVNCNIQEFLTNSYYNGQYVEQHFISKFRSFIAKEYFMFSSKDYSSAISGELFNFYKHIKNSNDLTIEQSNEMYNMFVSAKDVNLFKLVDNIKAYKKENESNTELIAKIEKVENYINNMWVGHFNLNDIVTSKEA